MNNSEIWALEAEVMALTEKLKAFRDRKDRTPDNRNSLGTLGVNVCGMMRAAGSVLDVVPPGWKPGDKPGAPTWIDIPCARGEPLNPDSRLYNESLDADDQITAEEEIAAYMQEKSEELVGDALSFSEEDCARIGRDILLLTLKRFRPDLVGPPAYPATDPDTDHRLFAGEKLGVEAAIATGAMYGFGNLIAYLKRQWAENLRDKWDMSEESALAAADTSAYPLRPPKS